MAKAATKPAPKPVVKNGVGFDASGKLTGPVKTRAASTGGIKAPSDPKPAPRPPGVSSTVPPGTAYVARPHSTKDRYNSGLAAGVGVAYDVTGQPIGFVQSSVKEGIAVRYVDGKPAGFNYASPDGKLMGELDPNNDGIIDPPTPAAAPPVAAPAAGAPTPPAAGAPAPGAPAPAPIPAAIDPRDSEYFTGVAKLQAENLMARSGIEQAGTYDQTDTDQALMRYQRDNQEANAAAGYGANRQGLLYSGELGKRRGLIDRSTFEQSTGVSTDFDRRAAARRAQLAGIGTVAEDATSPTGFTGTGSAGISLRELIQGAVQRRRSQNTTTEVPV